MTVDFNTREIEYVNEGHLPLKMTDLKLLERDNRRYRTLYEQHETRSYRTLYEQHETRRGNHRSRIAATKGDVCWILTALLTIFFFVFLVNL